jgi:hypothetical protein
MKPTESPYEILIGRGSHRNPLSRRWLLALAGATVVALVVLAVINGLAVPRPRWLAIPVAIAVFWLVIVYVIVWQDGMLRVYRRLASMGLTDRTRLAIWMAVFVAVVIGTLGWMAAFIVVAGHPN